MHKYIVLDIDGVLAVGDKNDGGGLWSLKESKMDILRRIVKETNANIVLSSSWRKSELDASKEHMLSEGFYEDLAGRIIGVTIRGYHYIDRSEKIHLGIPRGVEIKQWFDTKVHSEDGFNFDRKILGYQYSYVILDDDTDMLLEHSDRFLKCPALTGLSDEIADKAIFLLNTKRFNKELVLTGTHATTQRFLDSFKEITGKYLSEWKGKYKSFNIHDDLSITTDGYFELINCPHTETYHLNKLIKNEEYLIYK